MRIVLLSGGSGKRLWPMSNDSRSKQFLKVLKPEGQSALSDSLSQAPVSMLQRVWGQLAQVGLQSASYVCASRAQQDIILSQLGEVPVIEEPTRRDTFPAIALACTYLRQRAGAAADEVVAVLPVDHYVDDEYFVRIAGLEQVLKEAEADLALLGVEPTEATSKFGYIRVEQASRHASSGSWWPVVGFEEKPNPQRAAQLIKEGALWNCGVFCFRLGYLEQVLTAKGYPTNYPDLVQQFAELPKRSFDYEVVEQATAIAVSPYQGMWEDLGTWGALSGKMDDTLVGPGEAVSCENTHVVNELGIPVVTMGLQNTMVVATPDGILVADKEASAGLKEVISSYDSRPMCEERLWGSYRVLDYQKLDDGTEVLTKWIELNPGHHLSYQKHAWRSEVWTIVAGEGEMAMDGRLLGVAAGDVIRVYAEQWHAIRAMTPMKLVEVQRGTVLTEEDIVRRYMTWPEIEQHCKVVVR